MTQNLRPLIEPGKSGDRAALDELARCADRFVRIFHGGEGEPTLERDAPPARGGDEWRSPVLSFGLRRLVAAGVPGSARLYSRSPAWKGQARRVEQRLVMK